MKPVRSASLAAAGERGVTLDCDNGISCRISLLAPDLARVLFLRDGAPRLDRTWMVPAHGMGDVPWEGRDRLDESAWPVPEIAREETDERVVLTTKALRVEITLAPFGIAWALPDGTVFACDRASHPYLFAERGTSFRHHLTRDPADRYYGLGDKTGRLNLHGRRLRIAMLDSLGFDPESGDPLYKHWPFLIARDGASKISYGMFYDNAARAAFDLGAEHDNYYGLYRGYEAEDGDLDLYLMLGPRLRDVTGKFLDLTGRTALPPRWTLGYAQTAMAIADAPDAQAQIEAFIDRCAAEDIPVSAFHFGSGYTSIGPRRYVFTWNRAKFPDPERLLRRFHDAGMRVVANLKPCLLDDHPNYAEAECDGAFVHDAAGRPVVSQFWDGEGAYLDFTSQAAIGWWQNGLTRQVLDPGIDVGWNDNNEYGLPDADATCDGFGRPVPLELVRPTQALLMTRATLERQRAHSPSERQFTITRAGCPGTQRYAQSWSGDNSTSWRSLEWNLRLGLTMSLSGMFNIGHDIGGFSGPVPDAELLVRWTQAGIVHPRFMMNSWKPDGVYTSPWLHPEATPAIRAAIRLRYRLIPYIYSLMHAAAEHNAPVLRPTFLDFEDDPDTEWDCDQVMLGPFLLASPVSGPGERSQAFRLPAGPECWFDFYDGEAFTRPGFTHLAAPLHRLPLVVRAGAILPMTDAGHDFSRLHDEPSRCLRIFPGPGSGSSRFTLYEDDGISADGPLTRVELSLDWTPESVALGGEVEGSYALPYPTIRVEMRDADRRPLTLHVGPGAPALVRG